MEENKEKVEDTRGFDLKVDNLRTDILNAINRANLPYSAIYLVLKDYLAQINNYYQDAVEYQYQDYCKQSKDKEDKQEK